MLRSEKSKCVSELEEVYKNSGSIIITHYHGLTVSQITSLRRALKSEGANFKVVKNTLSKIAADRTGLEKASVFLSGPTAIAYSTDPVAAAKTVVEFAKTNEKLKVVGGIVNNQFFDADEINHIAKLPSLNELRGKIVGILQAPATKIAGVLQTPASAVARVLQAYSDK